jgi:PadR family transcriptional regulator PadR
MGVRSGLGEFEQLVLLAVLRLRDVAFAPDISAELETTVGRNPTRGALYSTLNRLEQKRLVSWEPEDPGDGRGGHIRRRFSLTPEGLEALRHHRETLLTLWSGVESVLDAGTP